MKLGKKLFTILVTALLITIFMVPCAQAASTISIKIDGNVVDSSVAPVVESGTTLVPLRVITENLGADVTWDANTKKARVKTAAYDVYFTIGSKSYTVNGATKSLSVPAKVIEGRTMIPFRALSEAIGATVDYNSTSKMVTVKYFSSMSGSIKISGSTTVQPISQAAADKLLAMNSGLSISVAGGGSGAGIKDCINGANNIGESSRELKPEESASLTTFVVANDGIALIVHPDNPVKNLTKEQAEKIFLGEITNWKDVGGNDAPILVQTRETGSGTLATLEELLLEKEPVVATATPYASSALIKQAVAANVNTIGFDSIGYVDSSVKVVSVDNIKPTSETVKSGAYILSRSLYVFTKGEPTGIYAKFIDYLKSAECQESIVIEEGYIPIR